MKVPSRGIGNWAKEIIDCCSVSTKDRIQRGAMYKNLYLTGDENGNPQTYPKTFSYIEGMSSFLYSPEQLRFEVCPPHYADGEEQAKCALAGMELNGHT